MKPVVLASNNPGKLAELRALLAPLGWDVKAQRALGIAAAEEPWPTFVENAIAKARHASAASGLPALADDSGLCVDALDGAPGVSSARYAGEPGDDARNNAKLVAALEASGIAPEHWSARFVSVLAFVAHANDPLPLLAQGRWDGRVLREPRGAGGFGYDAHFFLPSQGLTAAELDPDAKNRESHRGRAVRALLERLPRV